MTTVASAIVATLIVIVGRWAQKKPMEIRIVVGLMFMAIILAVVDQINEKFARALGMMVVVAALFLPPEGINGKSEPYLISIGKKVGFTK